MLNALTNRIQESSDGLASKYNNIGTVIPVHNSVNDACKFDKIFLSQDVISNANAQ